MDLDNTFKVVVYNLLIGRIIVLNHKGETPMVSVLMCMVTHWTRPMVIHGVRLSNSHDFIKLLYCMVFQP